MTKVYNSILDLIGHTPILKLNKFAEKNQVLANIFVKIEFFNPGGSVKDRIALAMIDDAEKLPRIQLLLNLHQAIPVSVWQWLPHPADTVSLSPCLIP